MHRVVQLALSSTLVIACAKAAPPPAAPPPATADAATTPSTTTAKATTGAVTIEANPPPQKPKESKEAPFANTNAEALSLIDEALEVRHGRVLECVSSARARSSTPDATIYVDITIDQEGKLFGVNAPKGMKGDPALHTCIREAVAGAPFPRSRAGLVTIKRTFEKRRMSE